MWTKLKGAIAIAGCILLLGCVSINPPRTPVPVGVRVTEGDLDFAFCTNMTIVEILVDARSYMGGSWEPFFEASGEAPVAAGAVVDRDTLSQVLAPTVNDSIPSGPIDIGGVLSTEDGRQYLFGATFDDEALARGDWGYSNDTFSAAPCDFPPRE